MINSSFNSRHNRVLILVATICMLAVLTGTYFYITMSGSDKRTYNGAVGDMSSPEVLPWATEVYGTAQFSFPLWNEVDLSAESGSSLVEGAFENDGKQAGSDGYSPAPSISNLDGAKHNSGEKAEDNLGKAGADSKENTNVQGEGKGAQRADGEQGERAFSHTNELGYVSFAVEQVNSIITGNNNNVLGDKYVFLTFDDGINTKSTPAILDVLHAQNVPGTFFLCGQSLGRATAPILQRIKAEGHAVAMHSFNHNYNELYPNRHADVRTIMAQAEATQAAIKRILGDDFFTHVWRYPGGHMSWNNLPAADEALKEAGVYWIDWNAMAGLADIPARRPTSVEGVMKYIIQSMRYSPTKQVYVVLMHDTVDKMLIPQSLPTIIDYYRSRGYKFASLH